MRPKQTIPTLALILSLLALAAPATAKGKPQRIAVVDIQRALNQVEEGVSAVKKLEKDFKAKQKDLAAMEEGFRKLKESYDTQKLLMSDEKRQASETQLQRKFVELQSVLGKHRQDLAQKQAGATSKIVAKMHAIAGEIAKEEGYTLVLVATLDNVLYNRPEDDITNELIRRFNRKK
jgi:outer membrane protein